MALSASVTSGLGTPTGTVTFFDNGVAIGTAPLSNGERDAESDAFRWISHDYGRLCRRWRVLRRRERTDHACCRQRRYHDEHRRHPYAGLVRRSRFPHLCYAESACLCTVSGTFTLREGVKVLASGNIDDGSAHVSLPTLPGRTHTLIASYSGSSTFNGSDSAPFVVEVTAAPTQVTATRDDHGPTTDGMVGVTIFVLPMTSAPSIVTGTITISENGAVLSEQPTTVCWTRTLKLAGGHHVLSISYSGDVNFLSSSKDLELEVVGAPPPARNRRLACDQLRESRVLVPHTPRSLQLAGAGPTERNGRR